VLIARYMRHLNKLFLLADSMGLVAFTVIGCNVAIDLNYPLIVIIMAGITTGIFGGILRDILCNRTPLVLREELYASVSLLVALFYLGMRKIGLNEDLNLLASFTLGLGLRLAAIRWSLALPTFSYNDEHWHDEEDDKREDNY